MAKGKTAKRELEEDDQPLNGYEHLRGMPDPTPYEASLIAMWQAVQQQAMAIEGMAMEFKERAQGERKELRQEIIRRHKAINGERSTVQTSKLILSCTVRLEGLEVYWAEVWYMGNDPKPNYNRIPNRTAGPDIRLLLKGAHPDEIAMITSHEMEARKLREFWREYIDFKRGVRRCINRALKQRHARETVEAEHGE